MRIGAVNYLNSKPLVYGLEQLAPESQVRFDLPSRLADSLASERLDVALIPTVELFRSPGYSIVSDACVACHGRVLSVKLHFRVPPAIVRTVALDEGSRTSAALTQILLAELHGVSPKWEPLPIGRGLDATAADAVLLIGDRAITSREQEARRGEWRAESSEQGAGSGEQKQMRREHTGSPLQAQRSTCDVWDLGEVWRDWTGLPFVFAMWTARPGVETNEIAPVLVAARDNGVRHLDEIAAAAASELEISVELATSYLRDNLHFSLGPAERDGLSRFYRLCLKHGLVPGQDNESFFEQHREHDCIY